MTTKWQCYACGRRGHVTHQRHVELTHVIESIEADHRKASPECDTGLEKVRVQFVAPEATP